MRCNALKVLVVETERAIASSLCAALERRGHRTLLVADTGDALERETPDVLICGVGASDEDRYSLLEEYGRRGRKPRSILVLSDPNTLSFSRARELGVEDVFARPFRLADLMNSVERISDVSASDTSSSSSSFSTFTRSYPSVEDTVDRAARDLAAFALRCGVGPTARARLATAVAEIAQNSAQHAYPTGGGMFEVEARLEERDLWVSLRDSGKGFEVSEQSEEGGGLDRAASLVEGLDITSSAGEGTEVTLRVSIFRVDFDEGHQVDLSELDFFTPHTSEQVLSVVGEEQGSSYLDLSPALAVVLGRLLSGPRQRTAASVSLWS
jgi:anti-sigma regulatory factor (Ser/Thr protein kinase)